MTSPQSVCMDDTRTQIFNAAGRTKKRKARRADEFESVLCKLNFAPSARNLNAQGGAGQGQGATGCAAGRRKGKPSRPRHGPSPRLVTGGGPKISKEEATMELERKHETLPWWLEAAGVAALVWGIVVLVIDFHADAWMGR